MKALPDRARTMFLVARVATTASVSFTANGSSATVTFVDKFRIRIRS